MGPGAVLGQGHQDGPCRPASRLRPHGVAAPNRRLLSLDAIHPKKRAAKTAAPWKRLAGTSTPSRLAITASRVLLRRCRRRLVALLVLDLPANNLAIERKCLKDDVESVAVFVRECETDIEPEIILAFAPNYRIDAVRRRGRLFCPPCWNSISGLQCPARAGPRDAHAWRLPARLQFQRWRLMPAYLPPGIRQGRAVLASSFAKLLLPEAERTPLQDEPSELKKCHRADPRRQSLPRDLSRFRVPTAPLPIARLGWTSHDQG